MKEYRAKIKQRLIINIIVLVALLTLLAVFFTAIYSHFEASLNSYNGAFVGGFQCGIGVAMLLMLIMDIVKYARALKSEQRLNQLLIKAKDERTLYIWQKSGSVGMNIAMYGLLLAALVAGSFDFTVFYTLLGATVFLVLVRLGLKLYYGRKY